jgi:Protein of unknown function (DUF2950)
MMRTLPTQVVLALLGLILLGGAGPAPAQRDFASPDDAVAALIDAVKGNDTAALHAVFGPGSEKLITSGDQYADAEARRKFVASFDAQHKLVTEAADRVVLDVGPNDWPLPIPLVQANGRWHFDARAGAQELVDRRIGRNEIAAIRTLLACVDAQKVYFDLTGKQGTAEYAQRLVSQAGKQDGLYWPTEADADQSPLGPLVEQAQDEGYPGELVSGHPVPYQGYNFRILKAQGDNAPGGAKDYIANGKMTGGFALVAWPAIYGSSGVMTFQVDADGVVFQKDLGSQTAAIVKQMSRFDPDLSWARVDVVDQ